MTNPSDATTNPSDVTVSAVICAYSDERRELLDSSIEAVLDQLRPGDQLVVSIDYNDAVLDRVKAQYGSRATVVPNSGAKGLCGARNSGIEASVGDVVAFVDDDAQIQPGWMERLREYYRDPALTGVGGNARPVWPTERPGWFPPEFDWVVGCSHKGLPESPTQVRNLLGCNMSFRRTALDEVGGFNSEIGQVGGNLMRCDETELCIRLNQKSPDVRLLLAPEIKVRHWVSDDRVGFKYFVRRCFWEGYSKYQLSRMVGRSDALSTERSYATKVLPLAVGRELAKAAATPGHRLDHLRQSAAVVAGLGVTTYGYAYSWIKTRFRRR
jgi:glycosyltransferase involved in cell wall biosynthesis